MALVHRKPRSICIQTVQTLEEGQSVYDFNWQTDGYLSFEVYEGFNARSGRVRRQEHRKDWPHDGEQHDLSRFDEVIKILRPVPKDKIYPEFPAEELARYKPEQERNTDGPYLKAPKLGHY